MWSNLLDRCGRSLISSSQDNRQGSRFGPADLFHLPGRLRLQSALAADVPIAFCFAAGAVSYLAFTSPRPFRGPVDASVQMDEAHEITMNGAQSGTIVGMIEPTDALAPFDLRLSSHTARRRGCARASPMRCATGRERPPRSPRLRAWTRPRCTV